MTIIQPSKNKNKISLFFLIIIIFALASVYIYEYNRLVSLNSQVQSLEKTLAENQTLSSDRKSQLYQLTAVGRLENLAREKGMILESQPQYLTSL
jgi:cell division protein FtsL